MKKIIEITPGIMELPKKSARAIILEAAKKMKNCDKIIIIGINHKIHERESVIETHCCHNCDNFLQQLGILQNAIQNIGK